MDKIEQAIKPKRRKVWLLQREWSEAEEEEITRHSTDAVNRHLAEHPEDKDAEFNFLILRLERPVGEAGNRPPVPQRRHP